MTLKLSRAFLKPEATPKQKPCAVVAGYMYHALTFNYLLYAFTER